MPSLFAIPCTWSPDRDTTIRGLAICSDPDTPVTFLYPDGKPYLGNSIWAYKLQHYSPWAKLSVG